MAWTITLESVSTARNPAALRDALPLLERLVKAFGQRQLTRFLDVGSGTIANWTSGKRTMSRLMTKRIFDLHDVLSRALLVYEPEVVTDWLLGNDPYLDLRRPIDVLVLDGAGPVIAALDAHESFGYA
ncbi:MAG: hypothetical protein ABI282_03370 [Candidatus Baltobacteraceae bacterium]